MGIFEKREKMYFAYLKISMMHKDIPEIVGQNEKGEKFTIHFSMEALDRAEYREVYFDSFEIIRIEIFDRYFDWHEGIRFYREYTNSEYLKLLKKQIEELNP